MKKITSLLMLCPVVPLLAIASVAQCSAPPSPGVRICEPTPNATVVYVPAISFNSTPVSGSIYKFIVYDNNQNVFEGSPYQSGVTLYDANVKNGVHNVVINAWDTAGNLVQGKVSFTVVGYGYPLFCSAPATPGINFCVAPANSVQGLSIPMSATATGYSNIVAVRAYLDGQAMVTQQGYNYLSTGVTAATPGKHTIAMVAWDSSGHTFSASKTVTSAYDYVNCPPKGPEPCSPGFVIENPLGDGYVGSTFTVKAEIQNNPHPISAIKVYLDQTQIAQSNGPTIYQTVNAGVSGTHYLTFQAWDTAGAMYRVQQNVNINVAH